MSRIAAVTLGLGLVFGSEAQGQQPASAPTPWRLRLPVDTLVWVTPEPLRPGGRWGRRAPPALVAERWVAETQRRLDANRARRRREALLATVFPSPPPDITALPPIPAPPVTFQDLARTADLNVELDARLETRVDRFRNLNCTAFDISNPASGCQGGFPTPTLDQQFSLRAGGVIGDRLHVNVDFDSEREFSANNTINVWYQGQEDDILRRVEVGNLDFQLPTSRFIAAALPANSFGVRAEAQIGPLEFRSILAQQKGSSIRSRVFTIGDEATQVVSREARDVEWESGRFFFVVNPLGLPAYPDIDVLNIVPEALAPPLRVEQVRIYRLRAQSGQEGTNPNLGGINAVARRPDSPQRVGPFFWDLLVEGQDFYLDPSGVWFALRNRVGTEEFLAVSYVTTAGDTVGTFPSVNGPVADTIELIYEPRRGPEVPTFDYELRNFYRVGGRDISRSTARLSLVVNESEQPLDGVGTYLDRLGLALSTDPNGLDEFNRIFPRQRDPNQGQPVRDLFVVFPHLQPFADSVRLLAGERNDSLYRTPTYLLATQGPPPQFRFLWDYEATGSGDRSQINLGAFQIRSGSERLRVGGRDLVPGRDYEISYELGIVTFLNPDSLFVGPTQIQAQFEENQLFDVAPSSLFGLQSTYNLGSRGRFDATALFQRQRTVFTRPRLGFEPQALFLGGLTSELNFRAEWLTEALNSLPLIRTTVPSTLEVTGEVAMSRPNPNQAGQAYVEEFEGEASQFIRLVENTFQLGSQPMSGRGVPGTHLSPLGIFDPADAVPMVWQNAIDVRGQPLELGSREIDSSIVLTGASRQIETLLWLTLKQDIVGGAPDPLTGRPRWIRPHTPGPRWRTITQPIDRSGLGVDLSRIEFLEFWMLEDAQRTARQQNTVLLFDFGTVLEDAVAFGPDSFQVVGADTVFTGFQFLGIGALDSEKDPFNNLFNAAVNDVGIHGDRLPVLTNAANLERLTDYAMCEQGFTVGIPVFPLGQLDARCTRRNGKVDAEDLNGDNRLDLNLGVSQEDLIRFVVPVGDPRFVVRRGATLSDIAGRSWSWRLYRIPFRQDTLQIGSPNIRQVRSLRIAMVSPDQSNEEEVSVAFARMKLVGAPWLKRAETPIAGLSGLRGEPHGEVVASVISTENQDLGYTSPPGVIDEADRRGSAFELGSQQINERSLRLLATDLRRGERAEAFIRFSDEADKNFLQYRKLRVWARGRGAGWVEGDLEFFIKVGRDENNFYLYRAPVRTDDWLPEVVVDLERWLALRAQVENAWLRGEPPSGAAGCGGDSTAFVACDGPYMVHVRDPGVSPPNLARVSELAAGIWRRGETVFVPEAELWVDDIRLSDVVDEVGLAGAVEARLTAADVAEVELAFTTRDDQFRQLEETPDYVATAQTQLASTLRMDKFLPASWGMSIPFSLQHLRATTDPLFVRRGDVESDALQGLRTPAQRSTALQMVVRRSKRGETFAERLVVDPVSITAERLAADNVTELSDASTTNRQLRANYDNRPEATTIQAAPGFVVAMVDRLPGWIRESEFGRAIRSSRLRLNPYQVRLSSTITDNVTERSTFRVPVALPGDSGQAPLTSIVHRWRNHMGVDLRPLSSLAMRIDYVSTRDLQDYGDSTSVGRLVGEDRGTFLGWNAGFERERSLITDLNVTPVINSWWRPRASLSSTFVFHRDPNGRVPVPVVTDTATSFRVPEALSNLRARELGSTIDLARLARAMVGDSSVPASVMRGVLPADVSFRRERQSTFDRAPFGPDLGYQLGFGGVDAFRAQEGVLATSAVEIGRWTIAGGTQLPLGLRLRMNFSEFRTKTWARRGGAQTEIAQRTQLWPSGSLSWVYTPRWGLRRLITSVSAQALYRESESSSFQPSGFAPPVGPMPGPASIGGVRTENNSTTVEPSVTLTWSAGIVTTARFARRRNELVTSGNLTQSDRTEWGGTMNFSFRVPTWVARLSNEVRTSLAVNWMDLADCIQRVGNTTCTAVSETQRRELALRLDTGFPPSMRGGASFNYILTEQRHTSSKFSNLILTVFLEINFLASQVR